MLGWITIFVSAKIKYKIYKIYKKTFVHFGNFWLGSNIRERSDTWKWISDKLRGKSHLLKRARFVHPLTCCLFFSSISYFLFSSKYGRFIYYFILFFSFFFVCFTKFLYYCYSLVGRKTMKIVKETFHLNDKINILSKRTIFS